MSVVTRHRSVRAAFAVSVLAVIVGVAPSLAATPVGSWKLKGNFRNSAGSQPKIAAANDATGSFVSRTVGTTDRLVWSNGDYGNGGLLLTGVPKRARGTYTLDFRVWTTVVSDDWNHIIGFGAGDDGLGSNFDPDTITWPNSGLYFYGGKLNIYGDVSLYPPSGGDIAPAVWLSVRITRKASATGPDKFAIFVNGHCLGAMNDDLGRLRFEDGRAVFLADDAGQSYLTYMADVRLYAKAMNPEACPLTV
jgi:hypothetical protein